MIAILVLAGPATMNEKKRGSFCEYKAVHHRAPTLLMAVNRRNLRTLVLDLRRVPSRAYHVRSSVCILRMLYFDADDVVYFQGGLFLGA